MSIEQEIILDGKTYILRPTFEALSRVEHELGSGIVALARRLASGEARLEEMAAMVKHCLADEAKALEVRETLARGHIAHTAQALAAMLAQVLGEARNAICKELEGLRRKFPD